MRSFVIALFATLAAAAPPSSIAASNIIGTAEVAAALQRGAILWDTRAKAAYLQGHIPGALNIDEVANALRDENSEDYLPLAQIERKLGAAGIDPAREVIVYGAKGNPSVYFALTTLQYFNAANPRVYHGGIDDWKAAGQPTGTEPAKPVALSLKLTTRPDLLVDTAEVRRKLRNPAVQILDVRSPEEFRGEDIRAIRGGHIPGAVSINYTENWVDPDTPAKLEKKLVSNKDGLSLKSHEQLKALYAGLDPDKETIVYCQSGVRASETAAILQDIGFSKVKVYDASWLGYGNTLDAPAESVSFVNVGLLTSRLSSLQKRLDGMEKEIAALKSAK